jgi:HK97 gp10 family phage protein
MRPGGLSSFEKVPYMEVHIEGLQELQATLRTLVPQAAKTAVRRAGKTGGEIWKSAIKENIEREGLIATGAMEDSVKVTSHATDDGVSVSVGVTTVMYPARNKGSADTAMAAYFAEFGTEHEPAKPFMRPAFDGHQTDVIEVFEETLDTELQKLNTVKE